MCSAIRTLCSKIRTGWKSGKRRNSRRGAEILEIALISGPLFGLTFLLVDLSMAVFLRSTFQNAVRAGVRYAITGSNTTGPCQDDSIKAVVKQQALGFLNNSAAAATIHVRWINPVAGGQGNNGHGNIVEVSIEGYNYGPMTPFRRLNLPVAIWARAYDVMEAVPGGLPCITNLE